MIVRTNNWYRKLKSIFYVQERNIQSIAILLWAFVYLLRREYNRCEEKDNNGQGSVSVETNYLPIADPYVMFYNNKYYAYGTGGTTAGEGFACFSSDDLKNWKREGQALSATDSYGTWGFWAPEVYYVESKKKFYLFYSAEEHICVATSTTPEGPFRQEVKQPIWSEKSIDTSLFIDDDGTPYLYFVRFTDGNVIWVAQMTDDLMSIKTGL